MELKPQPRIPFCLTSFILVLVLALFSCSLYIPVAIAGVDVSKKSTQYHIAEIVSFNDLKKSLEVHLFFDPKGNLAPHKEHIQITPETVITDGEQSLSSEIFMPGMPIDIEFSFPLDANNPSSALYIFVH
ncbi:MAG: hypothetical protein ACI9CF_000349 [Candidatus Omnitrophota bacterium]|jgi:hypothetical protein